MIKDLDNLYKNYVENKFHKISALVISFIITGLFYIFIHQFIRSDFNYEWLLFILTIISIFIFWLFFKFKYPKNNKNKNGLILSFYTKNVDEVKLKEKFIRELERKLDDVGIKKYFNLIEIKNHHSEFIKNEEDIKKLDKKVNGHLYIYGDIKKESENNQEIYFIDLRGYVRHLPIPIPVSKELSVDFSTLLPKEFNIDKLFELRGCKFLSEICVLTVEYIVGAASLLSRNPFLALKLHQVCLSEIDKEVYKDNKQLKRIQNKLPILISAEHSLIASIYYLNNIFDKTKENLLLSLKFNDRNYDAWLLKGLIDFNVDKNIDESFISIKKAEEYANGKNEWRYSRAFILFFTGDFQEAYKICRKIKESSYFGENETLKQVEEFNLSLLSDQNLNKPQLWFWIGYLQYFKKNDYKKSLEYFQKFINYSNNPFLKEKVNSFLPDIKNRI